MSGHVCDGMCKNNSVPHTWDSQDTYSTWHVDIIISPCWHDLEQYSTNPEKMKATTLEQYSTNPEAKKAAT